MGTHAKASSFPAVLKRYLSNYELNIRSKQKADNTIQGVIDKLTTTLKSETKPKKFVTANEEPHHTPPCKVTQAKREKLSLRKESSTLSETSTLKRRSEIERHERNYRTWLRAKASTNEQLDSHYRQKTQLLKELIATRDYLYRKHKAEEKIHEKNARVAAKRAKRQKEKSLVQAARASSKKRKQNISLSSSESCNHNEKSTPQHVTGEVSVMSSTPEPLTKSNVKKFSSKFSNRPILTPPTDVDETVSLKDVRAAAEESDHMSGYEKHLYELYGDFADYYLHPAAIETDTGVVNPKLKQFEGAASSNALWSKLREESHAKLRLADDYVPSELKIAYNAFIRQNSSDDQKSLQRIYSNGEDLQSLQQLLDQRDINKVRSRRYKVNVMYRMAKQNAHKTQILTFNNALPTNISSTMGVTSYFPLSDDDTSSISNNETDMVSSEFTPCHSDNTQLGPDGDHLSKSNMNELVFMTEFYPQSEAKFTKKFADMKTDEVLIKPYCNYDDRPDTNHKGERRSDIETSIEPYLQSPWQPLSMNALMDYAKTIEVQVPGEFRQGQPQMWRPKCLEA